METVMERPEFSHKKELGGGDECAAVAAPKIVNGDEEEEELEEMVYHHEFAKRTGWCCFWMIPCLDSDRTKSSGGGSAWWERIRTAEHRESWWKRGWNKLREWSEIAAGPKWKTFIRRFNRNNHNNNSNYNYGNRVGGGCGCGGGVLGGGGGGGGAAGGKGKFQYDPLSYSLNFDQGPGHNGNLDDDIGFRDFSSRYAAIPMSAKSSMDLGKDAPSFS